ncbi:protein-glutamate O-methyltransferase CheR [candidate division KSB1 bacterium]|nr:protein-glutamate O-methyltransferase CheR [candidate division KSB1 bacterium]
MNIDRDVYQDILALLYEQRRFDSSHYYPAFVKRRIADRLGRLKSGDALEFLHQLKHKPDELDALVDSLTINVSRFFRDGLMFAYLENILLPGLLTEKARTENYYLRMWSAGCATGEEPYSVAILLYELLTKEKIHYDIKLFATDIDQDSLHAAEQGAYPFERIKDVRYQFLKTYFRAEGKAYYIIPEIKKLVSYSYFDMLNTSAFVPPESVFGNFDIVFCRNLLIYFTPQSQDAIFKKLFRAIVKNGYLILGTSEKPPLAFNRYFQQVNDCCGIFQKIGD